MQNQISLFKLLLVFFFADSEDNHQEIYETIPSPLPSSSYAKNSQGKKFNFLVNKF